MSRPAGGRITTTHARGDEAGRRRATLQPAERTVLVALGFLIGVSTAWWAAALWPLPATTPDWVVRARAACFGVERSGLPHAGGWILLIGSPLSLLASLVVIWGRTLRTALRVLLATTHGRILLPLAVTASGAVVLLSGARAVRAAGGAPAPLAVWLAAPAAGTGDAVPPPVELPPDMATGVLNLHDHRGELVEVTQFAGAPLLVTFAYGRCETICPTIVSETQAARVALGTRAPPLVIITLDPWRDPPPRLPHIAARWQLDPDAHLLGGDVRSVERVLDSWRVERGRDPRTGEIIHPSLVYVVDADGRVRYGVPGWRDHITAAVAALEHRR